MKRTQIIFLLIVLVLFTFGCTQDIKDSNNSKIIENEQDPFIIIENNEQILDKSHFKFKFNTLDNNEQYQYCCCGKPDRSCLHNFGRRHFGRRNYHQKS